jgi:hypothetical protein
MLNDAAPPNNGIHPTANEQASHRNIRRRQVECARVMPGVGQLTVAYSKTF